MLRGILTGIDHTDAARETTEVSEMPGTPQKADRS